MRLDTTRERRDYIYDTFRENCATRLRDYLDTYTGGAVYAALAPIVTEHTFRDDVRRAYAGLVPLLLPTEVVPGVELDRPRSLWEQAYLPAALMDGLGMVLVSRRIAAIYSALVAGEPVPPAYFGSLSDLVGGDILGRAGLTGQSGEATDPLVALAKKIDQVLGTGRAMSGKLRQHHGIHAFVGM